MKTWEIRVEGIVQGVGFRPTVYALAHQLQLFGTVSNGPEGVKILCSAPESLAQTFYQRILSQAPPNAIITRHSIHESAPKFFESFEILESQHCGTRSLLPTPDFGICEGCSKELHDPSNRRFGYPFITCTSCGPRYSILKDLPYDRPKTSMEEFPMCSACLEEYHDPEDRRHFSQTNSCATCGVSLSLHTGYRSGLFQGENEKIQHYILQAWSQGKIVAIKGIGGYLLTCDASDEQAIQALRARKDRPGKPFALMVPEVSRFDLSNSEERLFNSSVAPILLVEKPKDLGIASGVADGLSQVGIMRPYAPLFEWLLKPFGKPIVATSANIHQAPILYRDAEIEKLLQIADVVLSHNREIVVPQDDSVVKIAPASQQAILMRRSRGWAPNYLETLPQLSVDQIWAAGADLKSCMGFIHEKKVYLSQYLGDLSHADTEQHFLDTRRALKRLLQFRPKVLLADLHPGYVSTRLARNWGEENNIKVACIQHHRAHFAAILGEHRLYDSEDPILGFIWDGTGFGEDGNIWGGEGFLYHKSGMKRIGHVAYFPSIAGDKMAREPRLAALALLPNEPLCLDKFSPIEQQIYLKLIERSTLKTSSMGRVFDAVASLLEICEVQRYEGEAALKLEAMARSFLKRTGSFPRPYPFTLLHAHLAIQQILTGIVQDIRAGEDKELIAAKFHMTLVLYIREVADRLGVRKIACSGGVFQNSILVDGLHHVLGQAYQLYFHSALSPNDENIAFGQLMYYAQQNSNQLSIA